MNIKNLQARLKKKRNRLEHEIRHVYPAKVGVLAKNHFTSNFRQGGFVDSRLTPWVPSQRQGRAKGVAGKYTPLLSRRNHLMRSIRYEPRDGSVKVINDVPYARVHNDGGTITSHPTVTARMRRFAWYKFYEAAGRRRGRKTLGEDNIPEEAKKWKRLALTKKTKLNLTIRIPRRQFIGPSSLLDKVIVEKIEEMITKTIT